MVFKETFLTKQKHHLFYLKAHSDWPQLIELCAVVHCILNRYKSLQKCNGLLQSTSENAAGLNGLSRCFLRYKLLRF